MSDSKLISYTRISPNCNIPRNQKITHIVIHHMAGNCSIETCGSIFAPTSRRASSNYGIGSDGRIGLYCHESNRSWCTSSSWIDNRAVTIEVADDKYGAPWHSSDKAMKSLIALCADICKRNGIKELTYTGGKTGNLHKHCWYTDTDCPGTWLGKQFPYISREANKLLAAGGSIPITAPVSANITTRTYLTKGDTGAAVKTMQKMLTYLGYSCGPTGVDGSFGPATLKAVKKFQKENGLAADGLYGQLTKTALTKAYNVRVAAVKAENAATTKKLMKAASVEKKETVKLTVDGIWGEKTTIRLQEIFCTEEDGVISNQWGCYKNEFTGLTTGWQWKKNPNGYGSQLIRALQIWAGMKVKDQDGEIGPQTIKAMEKKLGCVQTGLAMKDSAWIRKLQEWANKK